MSMLKDESFDIDVDGHIVEPEHLFQGEPDSILNRMGDSDDIRSMKDFNRNRDLQ